MAYITNDIVVNWITKTQVYKIVWMEDTNWVMVNVKVFDWEYTKDELLMQVNKAKEQVLQSNNFVNETEWKLVTPPTQAELDAVIVSEQAKQNAQIIRDNKSKDINKIATLSDQLNLLADNLNIVIDEVIKTSPTLANNPKVIEWKTVLAWIKAILNK